MNLLDPKADGFANPDDFSLLRMMGRIIREHRNVSHLMMKDQDVHPGQPPMLFELARHGPMRQSELAKRLGIAPATLTVMLNRMIKNGHVERRPDPTDQRAMRVYLTEKGKAAVEEVRDALRQSEIHVLEGITEAEKLLMRRLLLHMTDNVQKLKESISQLTKEANQLDPGKMD